ncbi:2Fe-2S iron-sulfur cluster-binding protein [Shewanella amazonensis]|uniref:Flavodoxin reductase (Ferredoxin-NADPH reductase) family 1-like protein n=1 Tax=Shewanella amazonensis (strain ATCC BAA-1098 / SB2B) TaxID=326297 RepID=A1S7F6_SHEAM|nr:2Fe-2S iron-sulfur cluster-binding protein [Shewanella amazonensis]ABM00313.1 flavodoxin reductase (ferredoxin-NADPH reductase) family 1-like protein [Shewanella amazonensis SB2B]
MTLFFLDNQRFHAESGETVLSALKRVGHPINYSCTKGQCRSCLLRLDEGKIAPKAQKGLEPDLKAQQLVYACQCVAKNGMKLSSPAEDTYVSARLLDKLSLSEDVTRLIIKPDTRTPYIPGLCTGIRGPEGLGRTYGIAPGQGEGTFAVHVRRKRNGRFSRWLCDEVKVGGSLSLTRPWGRCNYDGAYGNDELIVVAFGTGIGPALGLVQSALDSGHQRPISLYHWGKYLDDLYLHRTLLKLMLEHKVLHYQGLISASSDADRIDNHRVRLMDVPQILKERHELGRDKRLFLFGEPDMVAKVTEYAFLCALDMDRIHAQSFEYRDLRRRPRNQDGQ